MTPPPEIRVDLTKDEDSSASSPDFKLVRSTEKRSLGKDSVVSIEKSKRRKSKDQTSLAAAMVEATQEFKKSRMPSSHEMIQECVEIIMAMNLTISEKARAADLIRRDNAYLVFLKFDDATRLEWLKLHLGDN